MRRLCCLASGYRIAPPKKRFKAGVDSTGVAAYLDGTQF